MGSLYGSARPRIDIPRLIDLYRAKKLKLDELLTDPDVPGGADQRGL
jgi:Zn-dependent alcohol dehydrogenase